jgi:hypothetical protein
MSNKEQSKAFIFWSRQLKGKPTQKQLVFDVVFGIVGPVFCFMMDPIAFQGDTLGPPFLGDYQVFAYLFSGFEMVALALWLVLRLRPGSLNGFLGGVLIAGGIFSSVLGVVLIPYSVLGLLVVIGIFGFTPFVTAFVYFRNGYRAWLKADTLVRQAYPLNALLLGSVLALVGTFTLTRGIDRYLTRSVDEVLYGSEQQALQAARRLKPFSLINGSNCRRIADAYRFETNEGRKQQLGVLYREATGDAIVNRFID